VLEYFNWCSRQQLSYFKAFRKLLEEEARKLSAAQLIPAWSRFRSRVAVPGEVVTNEKQAAPISPSL